MIRYLDVLPEITAALRDNRPVVALESTILSHGMPYPRNLEFARRVEEAVREEGAVPATIAVLEGRLKVGLDDEQLELMCHSEPIAKLSRRDLPIALARQTPGATTVSATMIIAAMAGIRLFATGGIGGVHRGAPQTFDISADLQELSRTSVAVVCSGAKSILDIGLTLEYLETMGVPVLGYQTAHFPAFYCRESGFGVDARVDSPDEAAVILRKKWMLGLTGGVVVANPVDAAFAMDFDRMDGIIQAALAAAEAQRIFGKALTPFLLDFIQKKTGGDSLATNIELALGNARVAARISSRLCELECGGFRA